MQLDMTKGTPWKLIIKFMIPLVVGNIFQQFYNMADTIIVGRFVGTNALAAVGSTGTIMFLLLGFLQGMAAGFSILTAQRFGAGDQEGLKKSVGNAMVLSGIITIIGTVFSVSIMDKLLRIMNTPEEIFADAKVYIVIICWGFLSIILYNMCAGILRAVGNSKAPLYFLIISACLNIILDLVFILVFQMGVAGAALATVISQGISGILCVIYIVKKVPMLHIKKDHLKLDAYVVRNQLSIGLPMALQYSITAIGTIVVQSVLNMLGTTAVAAYTAAMKIEGIVTQPFPAMGVTLANYCAQNRGINDFARIKKGVKVGFFINAGYALVAGVAITLALPYLLPVFITGDITVILGYAKTFIVLDSIFFLSLGSIFVFREALQGTGFAFIPMMGGVVELVSRVLVAVVAAKLMSFAWVCLANGITWTVTALFIGIAFWILMRKQPNS